jgi:hypothetical protein
VVLTGEPGIGKSHITLALQERLLAEPHISLHYFCSACCRSPKDPLLKTPDYRRLKRETRARAMPRTPALMHARARSGRS